MPDERVATARAHWAARFVANGTSYADFEATLARIGRWDDLTEEKIAAIPLLAAQRRQARQDSELVRLHR